MNEMTYFEGETIFREGDAANTMFQVTDGKVGIVAAYGTEDERQLAVLGAGKVFGEMGLVEGYPRSATAVVLEGGASVLEIGADNFAEYLKDEPEKVLDIMRQMSQRLRETNESYDEACRAVYDAIEAERAGRRRSGSLRERLSQMLYDFTHIA